MTYDEIIKDKLPSLVKELCESNDVSVNATGTLKINSERIDHRNFTNWYLEFCRSPKNHEYSPLLTLSPSNNLFFEEFRKSVRIYKKLQKNASIQGISVITAFDYSTHIPFVSVENADIKKFYDTKLKKIVPLDHKTYELVVSKEDRKPIVSAMIEFNPFRPEQIYVGDTYGQSYTHINTYQRPEWQFERELSASEIQNFSKIPAIIDRFFNHLFPDKRCREFVFDWLHYALTARCETYLVLNGAKGVGKGILSEHICKFLMGKDNHKLAPQGVLESNFNAVLERCRMIVLDEFKIDDDEKVNKLKRYINKDQMIENKGKDTDKTIETFNSFIVSSNSTSDIRIEWDDRRFSVADLSTIKLEEVWSKDDIKELIEAIEDSNHTAMREFGYWLMYREPQGDAFTAFKGKHFYKLCYASLAEWSRTIIDLCISGQYDILDDATIKMEFKDRSPHLKFPNNHKVEDFIMNYKHLGTDYLGKYEKTPTGFEITVSSAFYKGRDNTGIDWELL